MKKLSEASLRELGLRKAWLDDKSGFWWEMSITGGQVPVNILFDQDTNELIVRTKILDDYKPYRREKCWSFLLKKKATIPNFYKLKKYGVHISAKK